MEQEVKQHHMLQPLIYQLFDNPKLKETFTKGNKSMKKADFVIKIQGNSYGLISEFVGGFSKLLSDQTISSQDTEIECNENFNLEFFQEVVKLFFGYQIQIYPYDVFSYLKILEYFGVGQAQGMKGDHETVHEILVKYAKLDLDCINFYEAWDYVNFALSSKSPIHSFLIRKKQILEVITLMRQTLIQYMRTKNFEVLINSETYEIIKTPEKFQFNQSNSFHTRGHILNQFTANDMDQQSFLALRDLYNDNRSSTSNTEQTQNLNNMFDTLNRHFGLVTTSFAALQAIERKEEQIQINERIDNEIGVVHTRIEVTKEDSEQFSFIFTIFFKQQREIFEAEIQAINEKYGTEVKTLQDKVGQNSIKKIKQTKELKGEMRSLRKKYQSIFFNQIKCSCIIEKETLVLAFQNCILQFIDIISGETINIIIGEFDLQPLSICSFPIQGSIHVVTGMSDGSLILWNQSKSSKSFVLDKKDFTSPAVGVVIYAENLLVSAHQDGSMLFWRPNEKPALIFEHINQTQQTLTTILTHANFSDFLLSGWIDGQIKIWEVITTPKSIEMEQRRKLKGHTSGISALSHVEGNRDYLLSAGFDKNLIIWNWSSEAVLHVIKLEFVIRSILSPHFQYSRNYIVTGTEMGQILLWSVEQMPPVLKDSIVSYSTAVKSLHPHRFSNNFIAVSSRSTEISTFNLNNEEQIILQNNQIQLTLVDNYEGHQSCVYALCSLVEDPQFIASGSDDKTIKIWDINSGACVASLEGHLAYVRVLLVLQQSDRLASASYDTTIQIWQYHQRQCERTLTGHTGPVLALIIFQQTDNLMASGGEDSTIRVWNWKDGTCLLTISTHKNEVWSMCSFSSLFASGHRDGVIKIFRWKDGGYEKDLRGHKSYVNAIEQLPDEELLVTASSDHMIIIWNWQSGAMVKSLKGHLDIVWDLAILNDPRYIVSSGTDGKMKVWSWREGNCVGTFSGSTGSIYAINNIKSQGKLMSGAGDNKIRIWNYNKKPGVDIKSKVMSQCSSSIPL